MLDKGETEVEVEEIETEEELADEGEQLEAEDDAEEIEEETAKTDEGSDDDNGEEGEPESAALTVTIEGEEDEPEDQGVGIRKLREAHKDQKKRIKELEAKLQSQQPQVSDVGEKPRLEDFDYDSEKFETAFLDWSERKRAHEAKKQAAEQEGEAARERYNQRLQSYAQKKAALGAKDFDEAEEAVLEGLSVAQQSVIIANSEKPDLVVYALGKNPSVLSRMAEKSDLISFAFEVAKLESNLKVTGTAKPKPEKRVKGPSGAALTPDKKLTQLEDEADRTGDRTKLLAYKRELSRRKG